MSNPEKHDKPVDQVSGVETTGHEWDGIKELNNPLPRWWLWTFYLTIIWGVGYTIAYPAWPMINKATAGVLGYSTRAEVAKHIEEVNKINAPLDQKLVALELSEIANDPQLNQYAVSSGKAVFGNNCSQCHGSGGGGAKGYPNLLDDDWLWGGTQEQIAYSIRHGIRNETDDDAHYSQMPAFGELLEEGEIPALVEYVRSLSDLEHDAGLAGTGSTLFADNCASCHGDTGAGDPAQGAPNLTDQIWLFGGDREALTHTIANSRYGVMPAWGQRLTDAQVQAVALYVHQLGGGVAASSD